MSHFIEKQISQQSFVEIAHCLPSFFLSYMFLIAFRNFVLSYLARDSNNVSFFSINAYTYSKQYRVWILRNFRPSPRPRSWKEFSFALKNWKYNAIQFIQNSEVFKTAEVAKKNTILMFDTNNIWKLTSFLRLQHAIPYSKIHFHGTNRNLIRRSYSKTRTGFSKNRVHPVNRFKLRQLCVCVTKVIFVANTWKISSAFTFLNFIYLCICLFICLFIYAACATAQTRYALWFSCVFFIDLLFIYSRLLFWNCLRVPKLRGHVSRLHLRCIHRVLTARAPMMRALVMCAR